MNGANRQRRRVSYRQRVYRRRKIKYISIICVIALAALFVIFLIIGNILDRKVEDTVARLDELESNAPHSSDTGEAPHAAPKSIHASPTALSAEGTSLDSRLAAIQSSGITAACFELDSKDGVLLYSSPTAQDLGYQSTDTSLWHLKNAIAKFDAHGLYAIGITHVSRLDDTDDLARSAAIGYHSALIAEALRDGVDEVLVIAPSAESQRLEELIRLADEVHRLVPDGKIGVSLTYPLPEYESTSKEFSDELLTKLWSSFDFFALDVCAGGATADEAEGRMGELLYYVLRYNMRILIPSNDPELAEELARICEQRGFENLQFMPQ